MNAGRRCPSGRSKTRAVTARRSLDTTTPEIMAAAGGKVPLAIAGKPARERPETTGQPLAKTEKSEPSSSIQIEIDPTISSGYIHDRYDLLLRGRVLSSQPIDEIA